MTSALRERLVRAAGHDLAVPVLVAVVTCLVGAHIAFLFEIPSWSNDEAPYVGYVSHLAHGRLPTIDSWIVDDVAWFPPGWPALTGWDDPHRQIWVANHPPFYAALLVPVWWLTNDDISHAVITMRLINTAGFGVWVVLVAMVARELVPRRPAVWALTAVITATPSLMMRSGFLLSDGWGSSAAVLLILLTIRMLREGPDAVTTRRVVVATLAGVLTAGTRAPGVLVVAVCCLTLLFCLRRSPRGLVAGLVVGGVPALATSWWYLRNVGLYGDLTGQAYLLEKFERHPVLTWNDAYHIPGAMAPIVAATPHILVALTLVPYAVTRYVRAGRMSRGWRPDPAWTMLLVLALATLVNTFGFVMDGGGFHDRYVMALMPLLATGTALAALSVGRRAGDDPATAEQRDWRHASRWTVVFLLWLASAYAYLDWYFVYRRFGPRPDAGWLPWVPLALAAVVAVLVAVAVARRAAPPVVEPARETEVRAGA